MIKTTPVQNKALVLQAFEESRSGLPMFGTTFPEGETLVAKFSPLRLSSHHLITRA
jgi:hypothetical protein